MLVKWLIFLGLVLGSNQSLIHRRLWAPKDKPSKISGRSFAPAGNSKLVHVIKKPKHYDEIVAKAKTLPLIPVEEKGDLDEFLKGGNLGRGATSRKNLYWDNYKMTIAIDQAYSDEVRSEIESAIYTLAEAMKCFQFIIADKGYSPPRSKDHLYIELQGRGCSSNLGRQGGRQVTRLSKNCNFYGTTMHEIMHVLGFYHEHVRLDREDYIDIDWERVGPDPQSIHQYAIRNDQIHLVDKYDFDSVMHYPSREGAIITPKAGKAPPGVNIGQRDHLSKSDMERLRRLYPCENGPNEEESSQSPNQENNTESPKN